MPSISRLLQIAAILAACTTAQALTITRTFIDNGGVFSGGLGVAEAAPGSLAGGGDLVSIFNAAADLWELAILDAHTVSLEFGWQAQSGGTLGVHVLTAEGGAPNRENSGVIRFDNDGSASLFADPTPFDNSEYSTFDAYFADLGGGSVNVGRVYTGASGFALGSFDLFSIALHEIGHSLGLSSANSSFVAENGDFDIDVTAPLPFAGSTIPTISGAHLNLLNALMYPFASPGQRVWISVADLLANSQISHFTSFNDEPEFVPEPGTIVLLSSALACLFVKRRRSFFRA